jgi:hypothetical protein
VQTVSRPSEVYRTPVTWIPFLQATVLFVCFIPLQCSMRGDGIWKVNCHLARSEIRSLEYAEYDPRVGYFLAANTEPASGATAWDSQKAADLLNEKSIKIYRNKISCFGQSYVCLYARVTHQMSSSGYYLYLNGIVSSRSTGLLLSYTQACWISSGCQHFPILRRSSRDFVCPPFFGGFQVTMQRLS